MGWNMVQRTEIPILPPVATAALRAIPLAAIHRPLARMVRTIGQRHPSFFARLGDYAALTFLIDPIDLPFVFRLWPRPDRPHIEAARRSVPSSSYDARIAGPLAALLGMVHGALDGDALFFSRDLVIEGNTEAILALRNAIDDAEIDLPTEAAAAFGPLASMLHGPARVALPIIGRLTGVALLRAGNRPA